MRIEEIVTKIDEPELPLDEDSSASHSRFLTQPALQKILSFKGQRKKPHSFNTVFTRSKKKMQRTRNLLYCHLRQIHSDEQDQRQLHRRSDQTAMQRTRNVLYCHLRQIHSNEQDQRQLHRRSDQPAMQRTHNVLYCHLRQIHSNEQDVNACN